MGQFIKVSLIIRDLIKNSIFWEPKKISIRFLPTTYFVFIFGLFYANL